MGIILGASQFLAEFEATRIVCLTGHLGSGKSLISHMIAENYLKQGYSLVTNMASVWADDIETVIPDDKGQYHCVVILDEGGLYVRTFKTAQRIHSFARKLDTYVIFSGRKLPHEDLQELTFGIFFNFEKHFLIPVKVYKWEVQQSLGKKYSGFVWVINQKEYYGVYSTLDPGDFPGTLVSTFERWTKIFFETYERKYQISDVVEGEVPGQEVANELAGFQKSFERSLSVPKRKTRSR